MKFCKFYYSQNNFSLFYGLSVLYNITTYKMEFSSLINFYKKKQVYGKLFPLAICIYGDYLPTARLLYYINIDL